VVVPWQADFEQIQLKAQVWHKFIFCAQGIPVVVKWQKALPSPY
jgi:hypothetical protein